MVLTEVMAVGRRRRPAAPLEELRKRFQAEFARLPDPHKTLRSPQLYDVRISERLESLRQQIVQETKKRELAAIPLAE
jgi:nicotinate phosphoribosyltransferase